jgi:hypothetical protein
VVSRTSASLASAKDRVDHLCTVTLCPTQPQDAAWEVVSATELRAVVKVSPDDTDRWSRGCIDRRFDARPPWLPKVLAERGWKATSIPDSVQCGAERRLLHVKDGLVVRWLEP